MARFGFTMSRLTKPAVLAVALGLGLTLAPTPVQATPVGRAAAAPGELVLPAAPRAVPRATQILNAGTTGFLWAQEGDDRLLWTDYATGAATALEQRLPAPVSYDIDSGYFRDAASFHPGWYGAGSDTLALYSGGTSPRVTLRSGVSGSPRVVPLAEGHSYKGTFGDTVVTRTGGDGSPQAYHLSRVDGGRVTTRTVTGLPAGAHEVVVEDGDARSVILRHRTAGQTTGWGHWGLVDLASAEFTALPDRIDPDDTGDEVNGFRLAGESVVRLRPGRMLTDVLDRDDLSGEPRVVDTGAFGYETQYGVVGSTLLAVEPIRPGNNLYRGQQLTAISTTDPDPDHVGVMDPAAYRIVQAPDGSVLVAGAEKFLPAGDLDWGVYRISQAADGRVERRRLTAVAPMPAQVHGLALGSGVLTVADKSTDYSPSDTIGAYRSSWLSTPATGSAPVVQKSTVDARLSGQDGDCYESMPRCVTMFADGTGFHGREKASYSDTTMLYANGQALWGPTLKTRFNSPKLMDLSGRWAVVDSNPHGGQVVGEFRPGADGVFVHRRDQVAAAVWGSTLWSGAATGGTVTATRLPDGAAIESFTTRNGCTPSALQAVGRWIYWTCVDIWGYLQGSGLYDRTTKRTATAPAGEILLGDGYLVQHVAGTGLKLIDLHGGLPAGGAYTDLPSRVLVGAEDLGEFGRPRTSWTVDRFGGGVAYADDQQRVHVVPSGVPTAALSAIDAEVATAAAGWSGQWWLSKPAGSWQVVLRDLGGATLRTVSGSAAHGLIRATWDGRDAAGRAVADGAFTWTLTAQPADGRGAALTVTNAPTPPPPPPPATLQATKKPSVSGTVAVGSTVKAAAGTWTPAATSHTYQWSANGTKIKGATGASYAITAAVVGKRLTVTVTARRTGHPSGTATSAATAAVAKGKAPKATKKPKITGTAKAGRTVSVNVGTWTPRADSYRYEWRLNGKVIRGVTGKTLKLKSSMRGKKITVTVVARRAGHTGGRSTSTSVKVSR